jgi:hypothetical protein
MVVLNKQEKEQLVLDLYNNGKTYRQIAKEARISPRDIGVILNKADAKADLKQTISISSHAYGLFSVGKTTMQVAIALNLREPEVTALHTEYWKLKQLNSIIQIYAEFKDDIWHIVNLHRSMKAASIGIPYVLKLLRVANEDLPGLEKKCEDLRTEISSLDEQVQNSRAILRELNNQITELSNTAEHYRTSCRQEQMKLQCLRQERTKEEALVKNFQDTDEQYLKIRSIVEENVRNTLSRSKVILKYASLSLVESMQKDPDKYCSLIYNSIYSPTSSTLDYLSQYHAAFDKYGSDLKHPSSDGYSDDCVNMLLNEAEKVYNNLTQQMTEESIADYADSTTSYLPSLPIPFIAHDEK